MAETIDELVAAYKRQKADAALAKASESGADAELVEAVTQARKATVRAEEEADTARRQAAELQGQLEEMRKELTAMTGKRDAALDDLRRALTERWAPDWWANARNRSWAGHADLLIRKALGRAEHGEALFASKYCLVVEGYAPWTPRLSEAVGAGCVPAILSPALLPPFPLP